MDENNKIENVSNNSRLLIVVMVVIGVLAIAGFVFMKGKKVETQVISPETSMQKKIVEKDAKIDVIDEGKMNEAVKTANDLVMEKQDGLVVINVTGENFKFMPDTITVKVGSKVKVNFESTVGFHDFVVDEFSAKTEKVNAGGKTTVEFVADKVGSFEYYCSVGEHRANGMVGKFIVTE